MATVQLEKQYQQINPTGKLIFQHTGAGITSKRQVNVSVYRTEPGSGIKFILSDLKSKNGQPVVVPALAPYVVNTLRNVVVGKESARLCLVEHFLAAATFCDVFDVDVVVDGPELPLGDGSAAFWLECFSKAGILPCLPKKKFELKEPIVVIKGDRKLIALPSTGFSITYLMDWQHPAIGKRWRTWTSDQSASDIASARTFGWQKDHDLLGVTDEVVSLTDDSFSKALHFEDEPVRHKLLDLLGDLTLTGINPIAIQAQIISIKGGHEMDVELVKQLNGKLNSI